MKNVLLLAMLLFTTVCYSQTSVSGKVVDENGEPIPGLIVRVLESKEGTVTNIDGEYLLLVDAPTPFTLSYSGIGFKTQKSTINGPTDGVNVTMTEIDNLLEHVVISASRVPEKLFESPVSIEQVTARDIQNTSSPSFYDGLENLKGVDINTSSLTFKSVNTRGFASIANTRFVQLIDGMDNSSPALNFAIGNLLGINELDVQSIELLPGASSALYGANAFNGILFINSKSPFTDQGASAYVRGGIQNQPYTDNNFWSDFGVRYGHVFSDKVAAKINFSSMQGEEWRAVDYNDYETGATSMSDPGYEGLNIYGDEVSTTLNFRDLAISGGLPAAVADQVGLGADVISRTGYTESEMMEYDAESIKSDISIHIKPNADDFEIVLQSRFGRGNTIYQGANRYNIEDFDSFQHKIELKNDNFFLRGYTTTEDAGNSYDSRFAAINVNNRWKSNGDWFGQYASTYIGAMTGQVPNITAGDSNAAHLFARQVADGGRFEPGSADFQNAFNDVTSDPNLLTGSKFVDKTKLYHVDGNYDFSHLVTGLDNWQVGGSWRQYSLNSEGTIFTDINGSIDYNEFGLYTQLQKRLADEKLKLTGSIRYDKNELFDGNLSPRLSAVFSPDEQKNHNIRASFQTGFRNPTTQDLYIGLNLGRAVLVGSSPDNFDRYTSTPFPLSSIGQMIAQSPTAVITGRDGYENAFTISSLREFAASGDPSRLEKADIGLVQPEHVTAYEIGYRGAISRTTFLDVSAYFNHYEDFISNKTTIAPFYGQADLSDVTLTQNGPVPTAVIAIANSDFKPFQTYTNSKTDVDSKGVNIGLDTKVFSDFNLGVSYTWADFNYDEDEDPDFEPGFNTPEHKFKAQFGKENAWNNLGFNLNYRWQDEFLWQSSFVDTMIDSRSVLDGQINYNVEKIKSNFKLGASNLLNKEYESIPGAGTIGAQYFLGWTYNAN